MPWDDYDHEECCWVVVPVKYIRDLSWRAESYPLPIDTSGYLEAYLEGFSEVFVISEELEILDNCLAPPPPCYVIN